MFTTAVIIQIVFLSAALFIFLLIMQQLLFFGFAPFLPHRLEVIEKILQQLDIKDDSVVYSLGSGRSGFLRQVEKRFPNVKLFGVEEGFFGYLSSCFQVFLRCSRIKVMRRNYYKADLSRANIIYCYLEPVQLREVYKKLKVEPRAGAIIISVGFVVPYLEPLRTMATEDKKRWYGFLIRQKKVLTVKEREYKRDKNVYFYEV